MYLGMRLTDSNETRNSGSRGSSTLHNDRAWSEPGQPYTMWYCTLRPAGSTTSRATKRTRECFASGSHTLAPYERPGEALVRGAVVKRVIIAP